MSMSCWKSLSSPPLNQSPNTLKAFDGRGSRPYGIINALPIQLEGNIVNMEVEVVDANLDYKLLLGHSLTYGMLVVVYDLFHVL